MDHTNGTPGEIRQGQLKATSSLADLFIPSPQQKPLAEGPASSVVLDAQKSSETLLPCPTAEMGRAQIGPMKPSSGFYF